MNGVYKVRAVVDTGCTNTVISTGMYNLIRCDSITVSPTTSTFKGVNPGVSSQYEGIIQKLELRFTDKLAVKLNVAVIPNNEPFFLIGNDCIGGAYSQLTKLGGSDVHCYMVVQDSKGTQDIIQFLRNRERNEIPVANKLTSVGPEAPNEVEKLFLV